jgi:predicted acetyltransferase
VKNYRATFQSRERVSYDDRRDLFESRPTRVGDRESRPVVENLLQLYIHGLSQFRLSRPDEAGRFNHDERYAVFFSDPDRCAYLFRDESGPVGFGLVRGLSESRRLMAGFFVVHGARRLSVGHDAAFAMLRRHPGVWEIPFQEENAGAPRFWRELARSAVGRKWTEDRRAVPMKPHIPDDVWITLDLSEMFPDPTTP